MRGSPSLPAMATRSSPRSPALPCNRLGASASVRKSQPVLRCINQEGRVVTLSCYDDHPKFRNSASQTQTMCRAICEMLAAERDQPPAARYPPYIEMPLAS